MTAPTIEKPPARPRKRAERPPAGNTARILSRKTAEASPRPGGEPAAGKAAADAYRIVMACGFYADNE